MKEGANAVVTLQDTDTDTINKLLSYFYTGQVMEARDGTESGLGNASALLKLAHRLEVAELVEQCAEALVADVTEENLVPTLAALQPFREDVAVSRHWEELAKMVQSNAVMLRTVLASGSFA